MPDLIPLDELEPGDIVKVATPSGTPVSDPFQVVAVSAKGAYVRTPHPHPKVTKTNPARFCEGPFIRG